MSTSASSSTDPSYKAGAQAEKVERLLAVFEDHVALCAGLVGVLNPRVNLDDARLVAYNARLSLKGERTTIVAYGKAKETFVFWNQIAEAAGYPESRYPSAAETIPMLVARCERRAKDIEETADPLAIAS